MASEDAASQEVCEAPPPPAESESALRVVLLGRTGSGRSSSGNTLLGRSSFLVDVSPSSITQQSQRQMGTKNGRSLSVIDTPGFFHTQLSHQEVMAELGRCVALSSPGPHVFLVTLQLGRFTAEERDAVEWIRATFGPGASRFMVVLFTWGDRLQGKPIKDFLEMSPELSEFICSCHGGHHVFDNSEVSSESSLQVIQLLEKMEKLVETNEGGYYSNEMFKEAETTIKNIQQRILGETGHDVESPKKGSETKESEQKRAEEEEERKRAERLFWCELVTAMGKGAAEGAGLMGKEGKDKGKGKAIKKVKVVERAAALAASPLSVSSAAKMVGGAMREGGKVLYKHRKTFLH